MAGRLAFGQRHGAIESLRQVGWGYPQLERAGEFEEAGDQRVAPIHFGGDEPGHFPRYFVFFGQAARQHLRGSADGAERVAQFVGEAGGKLAQRGQAVGAAFLFFGLLELKIGRGQLLGCGARFARLAPQVLGHRVGQIADHRQQHQARNRTGDDLQRLRHPMQEDHVRGAGRYGAQRGSNYAEHGGRRDHRQQQHRPIHAVDRAGESNQHERQRQLDRDPQQAAAGGRLGGDFRLQHLGHAERHQEDDFLWFVRVLRPRDQHAEQHQPDEIPRLDQAEAAVEESWEAQRHKTVRPRAAPGRLWQVCRRSENRPRLSPLHYATMR